MTPSKPALSADCHHLIHEMCLPPGAITDISSGVPDMDRLHHDLFASLDALSGSADADFPADFATFVEQAERGFREEELWMDEIDFAETAAHQEQHARVLGTLHHIHAQVMGGDIDTGRRVADELLPQWLLLHISTMDRPFAQAVQLARCESAASLQAS